MIYHLSSIMGQRIGRLRSSPVPQLEEAVQFPQILNLMEPITTRQLIFPFVHVIITIPSYAPSDPLPATPPIAVRSQRPDHRFNRPARRPPIRDHQLSDLRGAQTRPARENLLHAREQLVLVHAEITTRELLERREIAHGKMNVNVDPTRTKQIRVDPVLAAHREHHHALLSAARAENPVHEVQHPRRAHGRRRRQLRFRFRWSLRHELVEIFDNDDWLRRRLEEEELEIGIAAELREVNIVDVVAEEVRHGGDEARFSGAGGTVQEEAPPPRAAEPPVVLLPAEERFEVRFHLALQIRSHRDRLERRRMRERNRSPPFAGAGVHEEPQFPFSVALHFAGDGVDVAEIRSKDSPLIGFSDLQEKRTGPVRLGVSVEPVERGAEEMVLDYLVRVEAQNDVVLVGSADEVREVWIFDGREGMQIEKDLSVQWIRLHALVQFGDFEELVNVEHVLQRSVQFLRGVY